MVTEIYLNDYKLNVTHYSEKTKNHHLLVKVEFKVSSEDYHDITTLLYKGNFDLKVPERNIACKVSIQEYSTSITNLYEKDQVGDFTLILRETRE
ncbi:DUF3219 family protein [Bacillus timonensis]|uniref:DUF3219 family protein n=1 Tax=Bacillus timonensis TaxID=1033734 RepID=A0A4S3PQT7_9BACI|nr:DUF3219 family protein [Bacillus timonensis]THE11704.1 DUF3219 family protein [Bacillus timonensis]